MPFLSVMTNTSKFCVVVFPPSFSYSYCVGLSVADEVWLLNGKGTYAYCSYMISWSLKYGFFLLSNSSSTSFVFLLKPGTSPDFFILSLLFLLFLYVFSFNAFVLCYGGLVEVGPSHLTI